MFTECPECSIAFRVTAKVLQQAGGRVRCGGCGHAFSALENLTEEMPSSKAEQGVAAKAAPTDAAPTEATPGEVADDDLTSEEKFKETSKQLLQTLSELTGSDEVRIEDTGIEWAVVDDEDEDDNATEAGDADAEEFAAAAAEDSGELLELVEDDEGIAAEAAPTDAALTLSDDEPTDLAVSEGDEWNETLDEDEDTAAGDDIPLEVEEELAAIHSELSAIEDKDDAEPGDLDSQFEMQAEAMGLEISGSHDVSGEDTEVELGGDEERIAAEAGVTDSEEGIAAKAAPAEAAPAEVATEETDPGDATATATALTDAVAEEISMEGEQIIAAEAATRRPLRRMPR
jgi:predicted Zn finger-like uncharacterized protein